MHPTRCRCGYCYPTEAIAELIESGDFTDEQIAKINDYHPKRGETVQEVMERCGLC
jgi:hypothetical protein